MYFLNKDKLLYLQYYINLFFLISTPVILIFSFAYFFIPFFKFLCSVLGIYVFDNNINFHELKIFNFTILDSLYINYGLFMDPINLNGDDLLNLYNLSFLTESFKKFFI